MARRYGIDVPLRRRFFTLAAVVLGVLAITVGLCVGLLIADAGGSGPTRLWAMAPLAWLLVVVVGTPGHNLRTALDSSRAWALVAATSVTPREFAYGRHVVPELAKAAIVTALVAAGTWGLVLGAEGGASDLGGPGLLTTLLIALGVPVRAAVVVSAPARRLAGWPAWTIRALLAATLSLVVAAYSLAQVSTLLGVAPVALGHLAVVAVALGADRRLRRVDWAAVSDVSQRGRTARHEAPALPRPRRRAILAVDARRVLRSVDARMKPVVNYLGFVLVVAIGAAGYSILGGDIALPADVPRAELAAGLCAFAGYGASVAAASVLALDADRHAFTLWSLIPGAMSAVARVRAFVGSVIVASAGLVCVLAVATAFDLGGRDIALALIAVFAMAALGPVVELAGSIRWPDLDWADATEIGTSSGARYALGFTVGVPVAGALGVARLLDLQPSSWHVLLGALAVLVVAPIVATTVMSPLTSAITRSSHA